MGKKSQLQMPRPAQNALRIISFLLGNFCCFFPAAILTASIFIRLLRGLLCYTNISGACGLGTLSHLMPTVAGVVITGPV